MEAPSKAVPPISSDFHFPSRVPKRTWSPVKIPISALAVVISVALVALTVTADPPPAGNAQGTCANKGEAPVSLAFAAAFIDQKDDRKPILLILSDVKLPVENWTSEFDLMRAHVAFNGAIFFLGQDKKVFRTDLHWKDRQSSVSGYFKLKLDSTSGKELIGTVVSEEGATKDPKLDAVFHASLK